MLTVKCDEQLAKDLRRQQTAAARAARTRAKHDRWAVEMRADGWEIFAPGETRSEQR